MFRKVGVPILGIVENMSYFHCPQCGNRTDVFGHGADGARAARLDAPFLGEIPLHASVREGRRRPAGRRCGSGFDDLGIFLERRRQGPPRVGR